MLRSVFSRRLRALLVSLLPVFLFPGCGRITSDVTLKPIASQTQFIRDYDKSDKVYCTGLSQYGLGCADDTLREGLQLDHSVVVGFSKRYDEGTDPAPCPEHISCVMRGFVRFADFPLLGPDPRIVRASLEFKSSNEPGAALEGRASCMRTAIRATGPWSSYANRTSVALFPVPGTSLDFDPAQSGIDVTDAARRWWEKGEPNHGFFFRGFNESLSAAETRCKTRLEDFRLRVIYTRKK